MIATKYSTKKTEQNNDRYEVYVSDSVKDSDNDDNIHDMSTVHLLSFKDPEGCPLYEQIVEGKKTVEGRKNSPTYQKINVGDTLLLSDKSKGILECKVTYINMYSDVEEYLAKEGLETALGNTVKCRNVLNIQDASNIYYEFVKEKEIIDLKKKFGHGFLGIGIKFLHEYKKYFESLDDTWFDFIRNGEKIAEGRLDKSWVKNLNPYDMIEFTRVSNNAKDISKINVIVTKVVRYKSFSDLFDDVGLDKVLPGKNTYDEGIAVYRQWYSEEKEKELGVVGIFFKII